MHPLIPCVVAVAIWYADVWNGTLWYSDRSYAVFVILTLVSLVVIGRNNIKFIVLSSIPGVIFLYGLYKNNYFLASNLTMGLHVMMYMASVATASRYYSTYHIRKPLFSSNKTTELDNRIVERFPPHRIFWMPDYILRAISKSGQDTNSEYFYERSEDWNQLLTEYPYPARDEIERTSREKYFWEKYTSRFSKTDSRGNAVLMPRGDIIDYFEEREKWIFREYYAASGEVHDPSMKELSRLWDALLKKQLKSGDQFENEQSAVDRFIAVDLPAHRKQWGEWFFFHINNTFRARTKPKPPTGGPVGGKPDKDDYNPNI